MEICIWHTLAGSEGERLERPASESLVSRKVWVEGSRLGNVR